MKMTPLFGGTEPFVFNPVYKQPGKRPRFNTREARISQGNQGGEDSPNRFEFIFTPPATVDQLWND